MTSEPRNGSRWLMMSIMGALFSVLVILAGGIAAEFDSRLDVVEGTERTHLTEVARDRALLEALRVDICRLERKLDDLIEDITHRRPTEAPCP